MQTSPITVTRHRDIRFDADDRRVIARPFGVGGEDRICSLLQRILAMPQAEVQRNLQQTLDDFTPRHRDITTLFERHAQNVMPYLDNPQALTHDRRLLIGAYFTMEYSVESAALFNPSIVPHPDQAGVSEGELRFLMSLRATGEGHVSSIVFRTGVVGSKGGVRFDPSSRWVAPMSVRADRSYEKQLFFLKLIEMAAYNDHAQAILDALPARFDYPQLTTAIGTLRATHGGDAFNQTGDVMCWLARSNYELVIPHESDTSELVIYPTSENESRGIEDARLTRFTDDDGTVTYYGTYTAYNGHTILPQMFETKNFESIRVHTLNGRYVQNKGLALFPRRINGFYCMISRLDGENMFIMKSDNPYFWNSAQKLQGPMYPWEFVQIGNCGPPIETPHGWLLLTHGVGPVRTYCIGAALLDLDDPSRVIGHLEFPLIAPEEHERDGYVPNVVYTCGALLHENNLIIPYAVSDSATTIATVKIDELMDVLINNTRACPLPDRRMKKRPA